MSEYVFDGTVSEIHECNIDMMPYLGKTILYRKGRSPRAVWRNATVVRVDKEHTYRFGVKFGELDEVVNDGHCMYGEGPGSGYAENYEYIPNWPSERERERTQGYWNMEGCDGVRLPSLGPEVEFWTEVRKFAISNKK